MNVQQNMEDRLWSYIDGQVSADEKSTIERLIESHQEWREKYHELLEVHELVQSSALEEPSMRFTKNVMEGITKLHIAPATKTYINKKIIWGIASFMLVTIALLLLYGFLQIDWSAKSNTNLPVDMGKVDVSKFFSNTYVNIFMMVNVVLGLVLLDRVLTNKRKKLQNREA